MTVSTAAPITLLGGSDAAPGSAWRPLALGYRRTSGTAVTRAARSVRVPRAAGHDGADPAVTLAVVAAVAGRHAGQRAFELGSDLGTGGGRIYRVGVDLAGDPAIGELAAAARHAVSAVASGMAGRPASRAPAEPAAVRHRHGPAASAERAPAGVVEVRCETAASDLVVTIDYDVDVLDPAAAGLLLRHLAVVLAGPPDPGERVSRLALADAGERRRLARWRGTGIPPYPARPVSELVRDHARRSPSAVAISGPGGCLSYAEAVARADAIAATLAGLGAGREAIVAIYAERSADLIVTLLGVLCAGGAYLALDPGTTPQARLAEIVRDAGAALVITDRPLDDAPAPVAAMAGLGLPPSRDVPPPQPADVRNLAYISYTSGSTGAPKGVAVSHEAVARLVQSPPWAPLASDDAVLCLSPVAFDASTFEIWGPLCAGARLVVAPPGPVRLDELARFIGDSGVTTAWFTAGLFHQLVDSHPGAFATLRHVLAGGDVLSADHVNRLRTAYPSLRITNGYGPSENTTFTTCWQVGAACGPSVPIGRPIPGSSVAILDDDLRPAPVGVPGELYAGGAGVARGYHGRPGATADRFVPDPAGPGRLYRTGDLARWRPDGLIEYCGRTDLQVKLRGYRVELAGIEAVIEQQPEVREAIVVAESDELAVQRLVGYVRFDGGPQDTAQSQAAAARLRRQLGEILPSYLVPAFVVPVAQFPMTSSGKVDRARLRTGLRAPRALARDYVAPRSDTEVRLAAIWADVLRVEPIGIEDNFFELGGHSLSVAQLIVEMEAAFGRPVPARTVFLQPTVADLAVVLGEPGPAGPGQGQPDGGEFR